jgi:hypothetical protein
MDAGVCSVIVPAGNSNPSRAHGAVMIDASATLRWRAPHDKTSPSFIEIWFPASVSDPCVDVCIVPPLGSSSAWISLGDIATYSRDGDTLCTVVHLGRGARGDGHMTLIALAPGASASNDDWLIRLRNRASAKINAVYFSTRHASVSRVREPR